MKNLKLSAYKIALSKQKGLILMSTLMFIVLLTLLVLTQMQSLVLEYKSLNLSKEKEKALWTIEGVANWLINQGGLLKTGCMVEEEQPDFAIGLLKEKKGCVLNYEKQKFYYIVQDLGVFPCLEVKSANLLYSSRHFLISIRPSDKESAILQLRIANLAKLVPCEQQNSRIAKTGLLSWRYL